MKNPPREPNDQARAAAAAGNGIDASRGSAALRALAVVPARIGSTRLPRKMLLEAGGLPLFAHTARNVARCKALARVIVATDSDEVLRAAETHGLEALATSAAHQSGTDRVNEAYERLRAGAAEPFDVIVNVQGDEPELPADQLELLVAAFRDPEVEIATLCTPLASALAGPQTSADALADPAVVKVVRDAAGDALYFSRAPIPSHSHARTDRPTGEPLGWRHVGVYAFRPAALARFCALERGRLEAAENLEQLRWLEAGHKLRCLEVDSVAPGIDTRAQFEAFRDALEGHAQAARASSDSQAADGRG